MQIPINHWDLWIKTMEDGREVVQLNSRLAFDEGFIAELKERGVKNFIAREETEEEHEEEE